MDIMIGRCARYAGFILRNKPCHVPKLSIVSSRTLCQCDTRQRNVESRDTNHRWSINASSNYLLSNGAVTRIVSSDARSHDRINGYSTDASKRCDKECYDPPAAQKPSLFQKMKQMTKDYWYILIPVHVVTSIGWISIFYTAAKNGVDIVSILKSLNLSERYLDMLRGSNAGHVAVAYALYKLFTPIRYTVTIGGTTLSIRYLNKWGYLKFKPRSTIKEIQSSECAAEHKEKFVKTGFKDQQQTETRKT